MGSAPPNVIYLDYGREKAAQSTAIGSLPLGQLGILPDGREFSHARANTGTALQAGVVCQGPAPVTGHGHVSGSGFLASATTTENLNGHTDVYLTTKSVAVTKDQYAGGLLTVLGPAASTAYIGRAYKLKANDSAAVSSKCKFVLEPTDPLKADMKAGTTLSALRVSNYDGQVIFAKTAPVTGVTPTAVSAGFYFWLQTCGDVNAQVSATVVTDGAPVMADTAVAGSVTVASSAAASTEIWTTYYLGIARGAGAASQAALIRLRQLR